MGTVSAIRNLALLDQVVQAPFAALTLVYNTVLASEILHERFTFSVLVHDVEHSGVTNRQLTIKASLSNDP